jgi:aspartyl aminopeptidase
VSGAQTAFNEYLLRRLCSDDCFVSPSKGSSTSFEQAVAKSLMISADQAHACHPNYASKHDVSQ